MKDTFQGKVRFSLAVIGLLLMACESQHGSRGNAGGTTAGGTTGSADTGGTTGASTGGTTQGTGGTSSGGTTATVAGNSGRGGITGTGGAIVGRGGSTRTGGASGPGGASGLGGALGGRGGASAGTGGTTGAAGSTGAAGDATPSPGCGKTPPAATTARLTMDVGGTTREYVMAYPTSYDANHPYRLIYEFHGSGGTAEENVRFKWYGVEPLSGGSVIFVAPQGLGSPAGWPNTNGQDIAFVKQLVTTINSTFCVDTSRIFVDGFSYGAMFTNTLGCQMGDVFRAIGPAAGGGPNGTCVGQVAAVVIHGSADSSISSGEKSRDYWLKANHCGTTTVAMDPSPCVVYQGCDPGFPVAWCVHSGGHQINSNFFGPALWNIFSQL